MAPVVPPQENTESFLLEGTGVFMLTPEQRRARRLSVVVEKVATAPRVEYLNLTTPEPKGFWGYLQLVQRDFVVETIPLNYRRQVVITKDNPELEPIEQLRCLIKTSTLTVFDLVAAAFLAAGGDAEEIGQQRALYLLAVGQPRFVPTLPETGIYYEIENDRAAKITVIWQGYLEPCENPGGYQYLQPPRAPEKDESSPDGANGGGTRPTDPPPPERSTDPDSDNAVPPEGEPPIPTPEPEPPPVGNYRMLVTYRTFTANAQGACVTLNTATSTYFLNSGNGPGTAATRTVSASGGQPRWEIYGLDRNGVDIGTSVSEPVGNGTCLAEIVGVQNIPIP
jgi:hypothetical protein